MEAGRKRKEDDSRGRILRRIVWKGKVLYVYTLGSCASVHILLLCASPQPQSLCRADGNRFVDCVFFSGIQSIWLLETLPSFGSRN